MAGFSFAFDEITLVLFTTLAPSGAVAYLLMSLPVMLGRATGDAARRLNQLTCLPLVIAMVGLVASATHLGNPSNALYVFTGVGRSPLSTEVGCAVAFLALAGIYWLYSFAEHPRRGLQRGLLAAIDVAIAAFVVAVAFAYHVDTIITWSLPLVPASLVLNSLVGGPLIALVGFALARWPVSRVALCGLAAAAFVANTVVYVVLGAWLHPLANELATVGQLVPAYPAFAATFVLLSACGIALSWRAADGAQGRKAASSGQAMPARAVEPLTVAAAPAEEGDATEPLAVADAPAAEPLAVAAAPAEQGDAAEPLAVADAPAEQGDAPAANGLPGDLHYVVVRAIGALLALAGIFVMRFVFYMTHLTVGLGV